MFGIYHYRGGLEFLGVVAKTEEEAWAYIEKTYGRVWCGANRDLFVVKKIKLV